MQLSDCTTFAFSCHTSALLFPFVTVLLCALDFSSDATALAQDALKSARHVYKISMVAEHIVNVLVPLIVEEIVEVINARLLMFLC